MSHTKRFNGKVYQWDSLVRLDHGKARKKAAELRRIGLQVRVVSMRDGWGLYIHQPDGWRHPNARGEAHA